MPGDINNIDNITTADAQWLLDHLAHKSGKQLGTEQGFTLEQFKEQCKVVNPSGNVFSCADASYIYSHVKEQGSTNNYPITLPEPEPEPEPEPTSGHQFASKSDLETAVNLWIINNSSAISTYGEINTWDTSLVTDMANLFKDKDTFNDDISNWDVSNVTNMERMFYWASNFNQSIDNWNVSNVTNMERMFYATLFNSDISIWNTSAVTNISYMFVATGLFNQPIGNWDVSNVTDMKYIFYNAFSFNQDIRVWSVSNVTNFTNMFKGAPRMNESPWNAPDTPDASWFNQ